MPSTAKTFSIGRVPVPYAGALTFFLSNPRLTIRRAKAKSLPHVQSLSLAVQCKLCAGNMLPSAINAFVHVLEQSRAEWSTSSGRDAFGCCMYGLLSVEDAVYYRHTALRLRVLSMWPAVWEWIKSTASELNVSSQALSTDEVEVADMIICRMYDFFTSRRAIEPDFARIDDGTCFADPEEEVRLLSQVWVRSYPRLDKHEIGEREFVEEFELALLAAINTSMDQLERRRTVLGGPFNSLWVIVYEAALVQDMTSRDIIKYTARRLRRAIKLGSWSKHNMWLALLNVKWLSTLSQVRFHRGEYEVRLVNDCLVRERILELALDAIAHMVGSTPTRPTTTGPSPIDVPASLLSFSFLLLVNIFSGDDSVLSVRKALRYTHGLIQAMASVTLPSSPMAKWDTFDIICIPIHSILNAVLMQDMRFVSVLSAVHSAIVAHPGLVSYCEEVCSKLRGPKTSESMYTDASTKIASCWGHLYDEVKHQKAAFHRLSEERKQEIIPCSNLDCDAKATRSIFLNCAGCLSVYYCSSACQKIAWREHGHRAECNRLQVLQGMTGISIRDARYLALFTQETMRVGIHEALTKFLTLHRPPRPPAKDNSTSKFEASVVPTDDEYMQYYNVAVEVNYGMREEGGGFFLPFESISLVSLPAQKARGSPTPVDATGADLDTTFVSAFSRRWAIPLNAQRPLLVRPALELLPDPERSAASEKMCRETVHACLSVVEKGDSDADVHIPLLFSDPSPLRTSPPPLRLPSTAHGVPAAKRRSPYTLPVKVVYQVGRVERHFYVSGVSFYDPGNTCCCCHMCGFKEQDGGGAPAVPVHVSHLCALHSHLLFSI